MTATAERTVSVEEHQRLYAERILDVMRDLRIPRNGGGNDDD